MYDWKEIRKRAYTSLSQGFGFGYLADYVTKAEKELGITRGSKEEPTLARFIGLLDLIVGGGGGDVEKPPVAVVAAEEPPLVIEFPEPVPPQAEELAPIALDSPVEPTVEEFVAPMAAVVVVEEPTAEESVEPVAAEETPVLAVEEAVAEEKKTSKRKKS